MQIVTVILYVRDIPKLAAFYEKFFGMQPLPGGSADGIRLASPDGGCTLSLLKASVKQRSGAAVKIVFGVADIAAFKDETAKEGLHFGAIWKADGYEFANAKDPAGNSISISNRHLLNGDQKT